MAFLWDAIVQARSVIFVPGHRADRFDKAARSGADYVVIDLEDAVGPDLKDAARENVHRWLASGGSAVVRINGVGTPWYADDVAALADFPAAAMLPKISSPQEVPELLDRLKPGSCLVPLLETSVSVLRAVEVCSVPGVVRAIFGSADLGRELGLDYTDPAALHHARSHIVLASAAAGIAPPLDGATADLHDEEKLRAETRHAVQLGFGGRACLHPRQVPVVNAVFTPSAESVRWARRVVDATAGDPTVTSVDGQVVGVPVVEQAKRILARAQR